MASQSAFQCRGSSCGPVSPMFDGAAPAASRGAGETAIAVESGAGAGGCCVAASVTAADVVITGSDVDGAGDGSVCGAADAGGTLELVAGVPPPFPVPEATSGAAGGADEVVGAGA